MENNTPLNQIPAVTLVVGSFGPGAIVHLGKPSRFGSMVVTSCNGRTTTGSAGIGSAGEVTCKRCRKLVTA